MEKKTIDEDYMVREYLAGTSINQLATQLNTSRPLITRRLLAQGVMLRDQSESEAMKWSRMDDVARDAQVAAAHTACRGRRADFNELCYRAVIKQRTRSMVANEKMMHGWLAERRVSTIPQLAIGPYNCDLAAHPVAVEIFGGHWHWSGKHLARLEDRVRYILNQGWHLLMIAANGPSPLTPAVADYIVAYIQEARSNPTARREYRMVWRAGEFSVFGYADDDKISIEMPFTSTRDPRTGQYKTIPR